MAELPLCAHAVRGNRTCVRGHKIHQTKTQRLQTRMRGNVKRTVHRRRRLNQRMHCQCRRTGLVNRTHRVFNVGHGFYFGQHDMTQTMACFANDACNVCMKSRVINRVHSHRDSRIRVCAQCQFRHQCCVLGFAADGRAVFAIQGDIEHAHAKLLLHLSLQLQAFAHARFDTAVVIANRQHHRTRLCALQHIARMLGGLESCVHCVELKQL